jgi:hypothetical protein
MRGPGYITSGMAARIQMMHKRAMRKNAGARIPSNAAEAEMKDEHSGEAIASGAAGQPDARVLPAAAQRALAEAQVRRRERDALPPLPPEVNGRDGPDPVRYGDWEKKGIAIDF